MARRAETRQLALDLAPEPSFAREDFLVAECNRRSYEAVVTEGGWQEMVLSGPEASGKSHLTHIWAAGNGAAVIAGRDLADADVPALAGANLAVEDADRAAGQPEAERALFHLRNALHQGGCRLLLNSREQPARWGVALPDLASRIVAAPHVRLAPPDDALLAAVLVKLFDDRQVWVPPSLIGWLVQRMDRSLATARRTVAGIDAAALASGGRVTRRMAEAVLDNPPA